jgi:hypothetical protein
MRCHNIFLFVLLVCCSSIFGQYQSKLYNDRGQLIADTAIKISKGQLKRFAAIEDTLINQTLTFIQYPEIELEEQIQGTTRISFTINESDSLKDFKIVKHISGGPGLEKEVLRVLKKIRIQKIKFAKPLKDTTYCLVFRFVPDEGKTRVSGGCINVRGQGSLGPIPLDTSIKKWIDSVCILTHGKWNSITQINKGEGDWDWFYIHNKRNYNTGNLHTDTFSVSHSYYPRGRKAQIIQDGHEYSGAGFIYYPGRKKLDCGNEVVYLSEKGPIFYTGYIVGTGGCIATLSDTIYKGLNDAYVQFPGDASKYFVFINNTFTQQYKMPVEVVIGQKKQVFEKDLYHPGGALIACTFLANYYDSYNSIKASKDSTIYLLFNKDSVTRFHVGDTVLLSIEAPLRWYNRKPQTFVSYNIVSNYYPFKPQQIEKIDYYNSNGGTITREDYKRSCSFLYRLFHKKKCEDPHESDPVYHYLKKHKLRYTYK